MKSYRLFYSVFLMLSAVFLFSCEDEPLDIGLDEGLPDLEMGTISFKVDGEYMEFIGVATHREHIVEGPNGITLETKGWQIIAAEANTEIARLGIQIFPAELETGSFNITGLTEESINVINYYTPVNEETGEQEMYDANSGRFRITNLEIESRVGTMSGDFNASLTLFGNEGVSIEITDGRLNNIPVFVIDDSDFDF